MLFYFICCVLNSFIVLSSSILILEQSKHNDMAQPYDIHTYDAKDFFNALQAESRDSILDNIICFVS
jgi:hypothetical protein